MEPYQVFISYAREDEDHKNRLVNELQTLVHLGLVRLWHDLKIGAGKEYASEIFSNIDRSDIILPLVSPSFLKSKFCRYELDRARLRIKSKKCHVLPILISRTPGWDRIPVGGGILGNLQALPPNGMPLTRWSHPDHAWRAVSRGIGETVLTTSGASMGSDDVKARTLLTVGTFVLDAIGTTFDVEGWQHYYPGDHDAERGLYGEVEVASNANKLTLTGYSNDFKQIETVATIDYEPQVHRFSYSVIEPKQDRGLQYRFDLSISMLGGITVDATRIAESAAEVDPELTLQGLLDFVRQTFREQKRKHRGGRFRRRASPR